MTNEEKAVIQAARTWSNGDPGGSEVENLAALAAAVDALDKAPAPAPMRHFRLAYLVQAIYGSGQGAGIASCRGPVAQEVLDAWEKGIADLPTNHSQRARIMIQTWTELEA